MISEQVAKKTTKDRVIVGESLWRVGFSYDALYLVRWMSGLVEVLDVVCNENGAFFIVNNLDKTGELFTKGVLRGSPLPSVRLPHQPLYVSIDESEASRQTQLLGRLADG